MPVIRLLTEQHEGIINILGQLRRAVEISDLDASLCLARELVAILDPHTELEEKGLFVALLDDEEFVEPVSKLAQEHGEINALIGRLLIGEFSVIQELESRLRNHINNEENGIFPAAAVSFDGSAWDKIEKEFISH